MPGDGRSPRQGALQVASQSVGQLSYMIENARHVVEKLVREEQAHGRKAQQNSEAEALEMRQHI
eukprot:4477216-Prorocentrum_lima.AAC.1